LALRRFISAALMTMRVSQVENCERPSKRFQVAISGKADHPAERLRRPRHVPRTRRAVWNSGDGSGERESQSPGIATLAGPDQLLFAKIAEYSSLALPFAPPM